MPTAEIIAIGTELLLGESQDTNTKFIARQLREIGVDLYRTSIVGDNPKRIEQIVRESLTRTNIIITTGGLGPTVDDPTRQAVAAAFDVDTEFRQDLWEQIQARFLLLDRQPTSNNKRQAYIPIGAIPIENHIGTAPAFSISAGDRVVISLPGVPREMEMLINTHVIPFLKEHFKLQGTIKAKVLHTAGIGESRIDALIGDLETCPNPTVGLLAHPGNTDVRITAKSETLQEANRMIAEMETVIYARLGDHIFGADDDTLESVIKKQLEEKRVSIVSIESGLEGNLASRLQSAGIQIENTRIIPQLDNPEELSVLLAQLRKQNAAQCGLGVVLQPAERGTTLTLILLTPKQEIKKTKSFLGASPLALKWASTSALDLLRRYLIEK